MPHLKELYRQHRDQGLVVLGVHTTNGGEQMAGFVAEQQIDYPVAVDIDKRTATAFAVDSYPDYYLIDRSGRLRVADLANAALDVAVAKLLAEPVPPAPKAGGQAASGQTADPAGSKPDAEKLYAAALAAARAGGKKLLLHLHGPH